MNVMKKLIVAQKLLKAERDIRKYLQDENLSKEVRNAIKDVIKAVENLVKLLPALKEAYEVIKVMVKGAF